MDSWTGPVLVLFAGVILLTLAGKVLGYLSDEDGGLVLGVIVALVVLYALMRLVIA